MADDLFAIDFSGDEDQDEQAGGQKGPAKTREDKNYQSEEAFQQLKSEYRPKVENGDIWRTIKLPLGQAVPKMEAQQLLHAAEELYFFRMYAQGADFVRDVLAGDTEGLDADTKAALLLYHGKCLQKQQQQKQQELQQ